MAQNVGKRVASKAKSKARRRVKRKVRRINGWTYVICFFALVLGLAMGVGAYTFICRDDCFKLRGNAEYNIDVGASLVYDDEVPAIEKFSYTIPASAVNAKKKMSKNTLAEAKPVIR